MEIRRLSIADYDSIIKLWEEADLPCKPNGRDSRMRMSEHMLEDSDLFIGAFQDKRLVGVVIGSFDGRKGYVNRLAVSPGTRRLGIARKLLEACENALRERGADVMSTLIEVPNHPSVELFKRCGYVQHEDIVYLSKRDSPEA
jgi:ribosomal protein S18 acetylase RimI-like enzyme